MPTRREWLVGSAALAALPAAAQSQAQSTQSRIRLAVSTYSYWHFRTERYPIEKVIEVPSLAARLKGARSPMADWQPAAYKDYRWIVADPQLLGGKLAIRGTRLSVALILECLAAGMSLQDIDESFSYAFPHEALPEVLKVASELTDQFHVAA